MGQRCVNGLCALAPDAGLADGGSTSMNDAGTKDAGNTYPVGVELNPGQIDYRDGSVQLDTSLFLEFSEDMDVRSVVITTTPYASWVDGWTSDRLLSLNSVGDLAPATTYTLRVIGTTRTGKEMTPYVLSFHTQETPDRVFPTIVSTVPADNSMNVAHTTRVSVTFDEPLHEFFTQVAEPPLALDFLGPPITTDFQTFIYTMPSSDWDAGQTYTLFITGYDLSSNLTSASVTFTTAP